MSPLVILWILGLFFNTWTVDEKYALGKRENLPLTCETQLYKKLKAFSHFFVAFQKSALNFEHFEKKVEPHVWCISKIRDCKRHLKHLKLKHLKSPVLEHPSTVNMGAISSDC